MSAIMSDEERIDHETFLAALADERANAFERLRSLDRMDPVQLSHSGHKTREDAIVWTVRDTLSRIKKLELAFIRKYPD